MKPFPANDLILAVMFLLSVATTVIGALIAVQSIRIIRSVCGLAICCLGLAGLYFFLHSPFLALMEILIYIGAVCVAIIFAVMMAEPDEAVVREKPGRSLLWGGVAILSSGAIFAGLVKLGLEHKWVAPATRANDGSVREIGSALLTTYSMPFELISIALLIAILGALVVARYGRTKP